MIARLARMFSLGCRYLAGGRWGSDRRTLRLLGRQGPLDVLFFCTAAVDEQWFRTTLRECRNRGLRCAGAIVSLGSPSKEVSRRFDFCISPLGLRRVEAAVAVTSSSGVPGWIMPRAARWRVHMPHSLVSLHMVYPDGAFDGYNAFLCCGKHHAAEVARLDALAGRPARPCPVVGCGKMDLMFSRHDEVTGGGRSSGPPVVLLAPSWGKGSILETLGADLVAALLASGLSVVLRPHPLLLTEGEDLLEAIRARASGRGTFSIELSTEEPVAVHTADVMISDYSGAAYEYAFLRERPVVFVDVPRKETNPAWRQLDIEPMEIALRRSVGTVVPPRVEAVVAAVRQLLDAGDSQREVIRRVRDAYLAHPGHCAAGAADAIADFLASGPAA